MIYGHNARWRLTKLAMAAVVGVGRRALRPTRRLAALSLSDARSSSSSLLSAATKRRAMLDLFAFVDDVDPTAADRRSGEMPNSTPSVTLDKSSPLDTSSPCAPVTLHLPKSHPGELASPAMGHPDTGACAHSTSNN